MNTIYEKFIGMVFAVAFVYGIISGVNAERDQRNKGDKGKRS